MLEVWEEAMPSLSTYLHVRLTKGEQTMAGLLWTVFVVLLILWLLGFIVLHVSSWLIHLLLVIAVIVLLYNLFMGTRARV